MRTRGHSAAGTSTFGKYVLLRKLATGGMGEVFLAKQVGPSGFEKLLVIKRILAHHHDKHEYLDMFLSEAKLVARLTHSNIIQIHEMGQIDGDYFIAMEYLRGKSLRDIIDTLRGTGGHLPLAYVVDLAIKLCDGLGYAHSAKDIRGKAMNIIHRDVNPHNVLISYNGDLKLIDFGIAKSEMASVHTATGTIKGKFVYMSPEQSAADPIDRRSDIFSLGIVLYEMLTNDNPFVRQNVVLSLEAIQRHPVPQPETKRADAGPLAEILEKALQKNPEDRYQTCEEMRDDLRDLFRTGKVKPEEADLSVFLGDLFAADIDEEDRLLAEADQATSASPALVAVTTPEPEPEPVDFEDENAEITRRGRPPSMTPPPRAPIPITSAPFSDEEPTIAGDLDSIAHRSRMKSTHGLPQPEPTGQVLTLIPPEDVVGASSADYTSESPGSIRSDRPLALGPGPEQPITNRERMPSDAPGSIVEATHGMPDTGDVDLEGTDEDGGQLALPPPQQAIGAFVEPLSDDPDGDDPRQAETKEIRRTANEVTDPADSNTPVGVALGYESDPPPRDPSVSMPAYTGPFRRSMVVVLALVFVFTAVAGYFGMTFLTRSGAFEDDAPAVEIVEAAPTPTEQPDVLPAPDPEPTTAAGNVAAVIEAPKKPEPEVEAKPAPKKKKKKLTRAERRKARAEARKAAAEARARKKAERAERRAKAREERARKKAEDKARRDAAAAEKAEAARARKEAARARRKAAAEKRAKEKAAAAKRAEAKRAESKKVAPVVPRATEKPKSPTPAIPIAAKKAKPKPVKVSKAKAARKGILTVRSSSTVKIEHGGRPAGSAPSSLIVRRDGGTITVSGADLQLLVKLNYSVTPDGVSVRVESKPWAIVKHNGISLGKTPQGPVAAGKRHRFSLLRPGQRTPLVVSLVWNATGS